MQRKKDDSVAFGAPDSIPTEDCGHLLGDLDGVDPQIAARLARIAEQARNHDASAEQLSALRAELDRVVEHMDPGAPDSPHETPSSRVPARAGGPFHHLRDINRARHSNRREDGRSSSPIALLALGTGAVASVMLALFVSPGGDVGTARAFAVAGKPPSTLAATAAVAVLPRKPDPSGETRAKRARDSALGARFRSVKAEATTYSRDLHLTAQRKELEADAAFHKGSYALAISAYDMARAGYLLATERAEFASASMEKANIDAQVAMDAQSQPSPEPVGYFSSRTDPQKSDVIRPLILTPRAPNARAAASRPALARR